jgi:hypothetical protein
MPETSARCGAASQYVRVGHPRARRRARTAAGEGAVLLPKVRELLAPAAPGVRTPPPGRARNVGGHVAPSDRQGRHPLSVLRGGGIPHRRSAPSARGAAPLPMASQKLMSDPARPWLRAHDREPAAPATYPPVSVAFPAPEHLQPADSAALFHPLRATIPGPRHSMPSDPPASETDRAPPIPIAGVPFRSTRPFHASRDRAPSSFLLGGATREKALFSMSSSTVLRAPLQGRRCPPPRHTPFMMPTLWDPQGRPHFAQPHRARRGSRGNSVCPSYALLLLPPRMPLPRRARRRILYSTETVANLTRVT